MIGAFIRTDERFLEGCSRYVTMVVTRLYLSSFMKRLQVSCLSLLLDFRKAQNVILFPVFYPAASAV